MGLEVNNSFLPTVSNTHKPKFVSHKPNSGKVPVPLTFTPAELGIEQTKAPKTKKLTEQQIEKKLFQHFGLDADEAKKRLGTDNPFEAVKTTGNFTATYNSKTGKYEIVTDVEKGLYKRLSGKAAELKQQIANEKKAVPQISSPSNPNDAVAGKNGVDNSMNQRASLENKLPSVFKPIQQNPLDLILGQSNPLTKLSDNDLGQEYKRLLNDKATPASEIEEVETEMDRRINFPSGIGTGNFSDGNSVLSPANTKVNPEVAAKVLEYVTNGEAPFKPELFDKGAAFFVTGGNPYPGIGADKNVSLDVEINGKDNALAFKEADLVKIQESYLPETLKEVELQVREKFGIDANENLSGKLMKSVTRRAFQMAENNMWAKVAETVNNSKEGIGVVELKNSRFSKSGDGEFTIVSKSRASDVRIKGGVEALLKTLEKQGVKGEPVLLEAAEALAKQEKLVGTVKGVFRVGGKVLIVVGLAADAYKIYTAKDKLKATVESAGGWAGATAAGGAFAAYFAPADVAGPMAWAAHGVGTLIAGGVGYWAGSSITRNIYELTLEK